jgi:hypothetical protein
MTTTEQLLKMKSGIFFVPDDIETAMARVDDLAKDSGKSALFVYMAVQILLNGIASQLEKDGINEEV